MFLSEHYARKLWANHERASAQAQAFRDASAYILPVRVDGTEIPGILETVGYMDLHPACHGNLCSVLPTAYIAFTVIGNVFELPKVSQTVTLTLNVCDISPGPFVKVTGGWEEKT